MRSASVASDALSTIPTRGVLAQQVGQFFESRLLVVHREDDQAAGAVVAVHDLLILRVRGAGAGTTCPDSVDHGDGESV